MYKPKHKKRTVPPRSTSTTKTTKRTITRNNDINIQHRPMLFKKRILPKCQNNITPLPKLNSHPTEALPKLNTHPTTPSPN